jgi:predicted DNA-binding protein (UPF0251 family)
MPRPRKCCRVGQPPKQTFYKPQGVPMHQLVGINLSVEGFEAMRLADALGMDQADAADKMEISRPTFSRILSEARGTVAKALTEGWAIHIEGGSYEFSGDSAQAVQTGDLPCRRAKRCKRDRQNTQEGPVAVRQQT